MSEFFRGPLAETVGWSLLNHLWQATLLALIAAVLLGLMRNQSANSRYLLSCAFLILMAVFPVATGFSVYEPRGVTEHSPGIGSHPTFSAEDLSTLPPAAVAAESSLLVRAQQKTESLLPWLVAGWILGVLVLSGRLLSGWARTHRLRSSGTSVPAEWQTRLTRIAGAIGISRAVTLLQSNRIEVPMVIGWIRPVLLVPMSALTGLTPGQLETIFAHEIAHIRRHDYLVNLIQTLIETLFFYHPAVWWMSRRIRIERENCCDDLAVVACGNPILYARALTTLEGLRVDVQAVAANGGSLKDRILRLVSVSPSHCSYRWVAGASIMTLVAALIVAAPLSMLANRAPLLAANVSTSAFTAPPNFEETPVRSGNGSPAPQTPRPGADVVKPQTVVSPTPSFIGPTEPMQRRAESSPARRETRAPFEVTIPASEIELITPAPTFTVALAMVAEQEQPRPRRAERRRPGRSRRWDSELDVDQLIALRTAGVEARFISELRQRGYGDLSFEDLIELRRNGIDPGFISGMNQIGFDELTVEELVSLRNARVTAAYANEFARAGLRALSVDGLIELRTNGVSAEFLRSLREAGLENLDVDSVIRLHRSGVTGDFVRELKQSTRKDLTRDERENHEEEDDGCSTDSIAS